MHTYQPAKFLTGKALESALSAAPRQPPALIEGLLYERSILLVSGDPGVGKSTTIANIIAQSCSGLPVFGMLNTPRPLRNLYIPFERGKEEILPRLLHLREVNPIIASNLYIYESDDCPIPNLLSEKDQEYLIAEIERNCPDGIDCIFYDPIYQSVLGGLSNEDRVSVLCRFNTRIVRHFRCATFLAHHTVKKQLDRDGIAIEKEDPFYGSQFLKAHCTGSYYLRLNKETEGCIWLCKKDNWSVHLDKIPLRYHPENYLCTVEGQQSEMTVHDRMLVLFRPHKMSNKTFSFNEIKGCLQGVSTSYLRRQLDTPFWQAALTRIKSSGKATLYQVSPNIG